MHTRFTRALVAVICCIVLVASCARLEVFATSTSNTKYSNLDSSKWNLVWSDEFPGDSVDTNKWSFTIGGGGFGNNEQQYYTDSTENAYIENGCLVLNAIQESNGEENYTSAKLSSTSSWTYGRYEFRAKLPCGRQSGCCRRISMSMAASGQFVEKLTSWSIWAAIGILSLELCIMEIPGFKIPDTMT